jgi:hypothetical protein
MLSIQMLSGANPTTAIYNASAVKIYNALSCLVRFESNFLTFKNVVAYYNYGVVVVNLLPSE